MRIVLLPVFMFFLACAPVKSGNQGDVSATESVRDSISTETAEDIVEISEVDTTPPEGKYPRTATIAQQSALKALNKARLAVKLPVVNELAILNQAAQAHAAFVTNHCSEYDGLGLSPHEEDPSYGDDFTGTWPWDRTSAAGVGEVIAFYADPNAAVDAWVNTLYHRLLIFDMRLVEIGYGKSEGKASCPRPYGKTDVMDLGMGSIPTSVPDFIFYPPDGAIGMPKSFEGNESPQPPIPKGGYPSGTMITLQIQKNVQWLGHKITEVDTKRDIPHMAISNVPDTDAHVAEDPQSMSGINPYLALYPYAPLNPNTRYRVEVRINLAGENLGLATTFTTGE